MGSRKDSPVPFDNGFDASQLIDLLMPLGDKDYGVVVAAMDRRDGGDGYYVALTVTRKYNRKRIARIIAKHAPGRDIRISETKGRAKRH